MPESPRLSLEQRLVKDEARLARDEALLALQDDVGSISRSAPAGSVGTDALRDGTVSAEKLATGAVGREALAAGAVGPGQLAPGAVRGAHVAPDSLTGADIRERSLAPVPAARDAARLGGVRAGAYLSQPFEVSATSATDASRAKGPLSARCPIGSHVVSGGASIEGATTGASIVSSAPGDRTAWTATARVVHTPAPAWRLVVTAICAVGGE